jgi:3-oxoacyl-[acyl-carrier protein] reductase
MHNKRVLITGGAGGLGAKASWEFAAQGAQVIALDRGGDIGERLGAVGTAYGTVSGSVGWLDVDLADTTVLSDAIEAEIRRNGAFDVLINNAAIYPSKPFLDYADEELMQVHAVNTHAPLRLAQMLVPGMRSKGWGRIINISSITFHGGWGELLPYVTSKGALVGATRALARELGVHGITVNCVSPEAIHPDPEAYNALVIGHQSIKHRGEAADIAHALLFLASERSGFITGQTLAVDGGWYMS